MVEYTVEQFELVLGVEVQVFVQLAEVGGFEMERALKLHLQGPRVVILLSHDRGQAAESAAGLGRLKAAQPVFGAPVTRRQRLYGAILGVHQ